MEQRDEFIAQVLSTIDEAEVTTIFFPNLAKALVVDVRTSAEEKPLVKVVNQVNSMEERMSNIEKMRPSLGRVRSIAGIPWTKSIRSLGENEVVNRIERRLVMAGLELYEAQQFCADAFTKLKQVEQAQWVDLIKGVSPLYKVIWQGASRLS